MVINALSVCVSVMFTTLLLIRPLPAIPPWLQRVAGKTNKNWPSLEGKLSEKTDQKDNQGNNDQLEHVEDVSGDKNMNDLADKVADLLSERQRITQTLKEPNKDEGLERQWKQIASSLNKILLTFFTLVFLSMFVLALLFWIQF